MRIMQVLLKKQKKTHNKLPLSPLPAVEQQVCVTRPAAEIYSLLQDFSASLWSWKCFLLPNKGAGARGPEGHNNRR